MKQFDSFLHKLQDPVAVRFLYLSLLCMLPVPCVHLHAVACSLMQDFY